MAIIDELFNVFIHLVPVVVGSYDLLGLSNPRVYRGDLVMGFY
jgi:hypothetical protein